jgi:hypothetical protein
MDPSQFWISFVLAALATWRMTHLLVYEDGPGNIVARLRALLPGSLIRALAGCFGCLSLWVAAPFAFFVSTRILDTVVAWLALSGSAFLLERLSPEPLVVERVAESSEGDQANGMLRPGTLSADPSGGGSPAEGR